MKSVRPKKHLGQHFLKDLNIAERIVNSFIPHEEFHTAVEIGPGTGVLTQYLLKDKNHQYVFLDVDKDSIEYLKENYPEHETQFIYGDFLKIKLDEMHNGSMGVIGNFPYNISSQIFFKVLEYRNEVPVVVGMIQKEVAKRIASPPGSKVYGILSVLLQAFYEVEYLFTVPPGVFNPPPKVDSAVIKLTRNKVKSLDCNEKLFFQVVKQAFNNRRKTLRNALKALITDDETKSLSLLNQRAEQLSVEDFVALTNALDRGRNS